MSCPRHSKLITTCIFDLDGVIVDTAKFHYLAWQRLAKEMGITFTETDNERLKGVSRMESLDILLSLGSKSYDQKAKDEMATRKNAWFVDYINAMKPDDVFPGVRELLQQLRQQGYKLGLASSSKNAATVLSRVGIAELFDTIVDGNMIKNSKPDPEVFLLAASNLKAKPSECLVFEDAEAGVEAAVRAGMKSVGIGSSQQLGKANRVVARTGDFKTDWIANL